MPLKIGADLFAVGVGHYIGKANVGEMLTKKGYKVTRVTE